MRIEAYKSICFYDAEQTPKSAAPKKNAELIKEQTSFVCNNKLLMKSDEQCIINGKITLEIINSHITRQDARGLVGEVV